MSVQYPHHYEHVLLFEVHEIEDYMDQHRLELSDKWTIMEYAVAAIIGYGSPTPNHITLKDRESLPDYFNHDYVDDWMNDIIREIIQLYGQHIQRILFFISSQFPISSKLQIHNLTVINGILTLYMREDSDPYLTSRFNYYAKLSYLE